MLGPRQGIVAAMLLTMFISLSGCANGLNAVDSTQRKANEARYAKAKALFEERCKTAGITIKRTVKNVEGIELLKVRPQLAWGDRRYFDPMFDGAALAGEAQGIGYIESFLWTEYRNKSLPTQRGQLHPASGQSAANELPPQQGYRYVEAIDPLDGRKYRYELPPHISRNRSDDPGVFRKKPGEVKPKYAIDFEDIVDPSDRINWIAGTRIKVIDQESGEVIAQLTRYVWDPELGSTSAGRWPWQHADGREDRNCPKPYEMGYQTRKFVDTVLAPKQGE